MTRQPPFLRLIGRAEACLPGFLTAAADVSGQRDAMMPGATRRRRLALLPIVLAPALIPLMRFGMRGLRDNWAYWRPMALDTLMVIAAATLVAAIGAGIHAWRHHA